MQILSNNFETLYLGFFIGHGVRVDGGAWSHVDVAGNRLYSPASGQKIPRVTSTK